MVVVLFQFFYQVFLNFCVYYVVDIIGWYDVVDMCYYVDSLV